MTNTRTKIKRWLKSTGIITILSIVLIGIIVVEWYEIHQHTKHIGLALKSVDAIKNFPASSNAAIWQEQLDMFFDFTASKLTTIGVLVALAGVILTFAAFYIQYRFNLNQKQDLSNERFENQYFHLLDVYRDICNTTQMPNVGSGKIAFHYMFYEYKAIYNQCLTLKVLPTDSSFEQYNNLAYKIFIDGVSCDFLPNISKVEVDKEQLCQLRDQLLGFQKASESHNSTTGIDQGVKYIRDYKGRQIKYFDGHRLRLASYFKYILLIFDHILQLQGKDEREKAAILRYLSAEMSEHEIGLLYSHMHYTQPDNKYLPYLEQIYTCISKDMETRMLFDNAQFIK